MIYVCKICGHTNDEDDTPMDYFLDGVACIKCIVALEQEQGDEN